MAGVFISTPKYVQERGALSNLCKYVQRYGNSVLLIISRGGWERFGERLSEGFKGSDIAYEVCTFGGECTQAEIAKIRREASKKRSEVIIGIGGGKVMDTAKAVAWFEKLPVIICPTVAASDAPCSAIAAVYTPSGEPESYIMMDKNPDMVIVDTEAIASSPVRMTVAGMGDALATWYEYKACEIAGSISPAGGKQLLAAGALAELCRDILYRDGRRALADARKGLLSRPFENVIEANTLLSGLGFENGGLAAAHAISDGLGTLAECHHLLHGEKVAFGLVCQLILEDNEDLARVQRFFVDVGLPITLSQMGISEVTEEKLIRIAKGACADGSVIYNMPFEITEEVVREAVRKADAAGRTII